jgi:hypothetical protein
MSETFTALDIRPNGERVLATGLTMPEVHAYTAPEDVWALTFRKEGTTVTRMIELTDLMDSDNETYAVVPIDRVAATIRGWFELGEDFIPENHIEAEIDELQAALIAEDFELAREIAAEIAVGFDEAQPVASELARRELAEGPAIVGRTSLHRGAWFVR